MTDTAKLTQGIYQRGDVYWLAIQRAGKRRWITLETTDAMEAVKRAEEIRALPLDGERTAFLETIEAFIADKKRLKEYSKATERVHGAALREFATRAGKRTPDHITENLALEHYTALQERVEESTAQIHIRALRAFFNWCVEKGRAHKNPFKKLKLAQVKQPARVVYCTKKQREELIAGLPNDDLRFIYLTGFDAGLRKNEIIEARVSMFDVGKNAAVHMQNTETLELKDNEARTIPMTKRLQKFLRGYLAGKKPDDFALKPEVEHGKGTYRYDFHRPFDDYLDATSADGQPLGRRTLTFNGKRFTAHVMRHTFASLLVQAGVSIYKVAKWLGDGVEVVEDHYGHLAPKDADIERAS